MYNMGPIKETSNTLVYVPTRHCFLRKGPRVAIEVKSSNQESTSNDKSESYDPLAGLNGIRLGVPQINNISPKGTC